MVQYFIDFRYHTFPSLSLHSVPFMSKYVTFKPHLWFLQVLLTQAQRHSSCCNEQKLQPATALSALTLSLQAAAWAITLNSAWNEINLQTCTCWKKDESLPTNQPEFQAAVWRSMESSLVPLSCSGIEEGAQEDETQLWKTQLVSTNSISLYFKINITIQ